MDVRWEGEQKDAGMAEPDFYLSEEQLQLQRALRDFVAKEIAPLAAECDARERYPVELFPRLGALGYLGLGFPQGVGGSGGCRLDYAILCEELAYGSGGIALGIYVHMALACASIRQASSSCPFLCNARVFSRRGLDFSSNSMASFLLKLARPSATREAS